VVVAPDAADARQWQPPQDGPTLLRDVVEEMKPSHIDLRRIYLFGYSAGAVFALYMAPLEPRYFAAAAAHAGAYRGESELGFLESAPRKVPLFLSVGTEDRLFPRAVVLETVDRLRGAGYPVTTSFVPGGHSYGSSREINERAWRFLEQHRLPADAVFVAVPFRPEG
jgi:predicted esterase